MLGSEAWCVRIQAVPDAGPDRWIGSGSAGEEREATSKEQNRCAECDHRATHETGDDRDREHRTFLLLERGALTSWEDEARL